MPEYSQDPEKVRSMFAAIAARYDLANTVLSLGIHHLWKRRVAALAAAVPGPVLDLCTGTGDIAALLAERGQKVAGADFCLPMLQQAPKSASGAGLHLAQADALRLPFPDGTFGAVTIAFGLRNLADPIAGLAEMHRVLRAGGTLIVLEFGRPSFAPWAAVYRTYQRVLMPLVGGLVTGEPEAYRYLPETSHAFPCGAALGDRLRQVGYADVRWHDLSGGIAYLYTATAAQQALEPAAKGAAA